MKKWIHPDVKDIKVACSCGQEFMVRASSKEDLRKVEVCSKCHPFYTGEQKMLKTGSIDKFYARMKKTEWLTK